MPNEKATIITTALDSKELQKSISEVVNNVNEAAKKIVSSWDGSFAKLEKRLEDINSKIGSIGSKSAGSTTKAIDDIGKSAEAATTKLNDLARAKERAVSTSPKGTFNALEEQIKKAEKERGKMAIGSTQAAEANERIAGMRKVLSEGKKTEQELERLREQAVRNEEQRQARILKASQAPYKAAFNEANTMSTKTLELAEQKLARINDAAKQMRGSGLFDQTQLNKAERAIDAVERKIKSLEQEIARSAKNLNQKELFGALSMPTDSIDKATNKLQRLQDLASKYQGAGILDEAQWNRLQNKIAETQKKIQAFSDASKAQATKSFQDRIFVAGKQDDATISSAEKKLRELLAIKNELRKSPILDTRDMADLDSKIRNIINKLRQLREQARPIRMKDVLGMDENSVDAISRKMSALKKVQVDPNSAGQIRQLGNEYQRLSRLQSEMLGRNTQLARSNEALGRSFNYIRARVAYALTIGAATNFVRNLYDIRGQYELLERSLGVLVNSFQKGSQIFQELNAMAVKSPFTLLELAGAAKQLTAYDFAANEVVDTTRRLADISAALGVPMERLTYNLGQIRAQGVLTARDARDFANAGLPIVKSLADMYTQLEGRIVSTGDVYDRMSKKAVSYTDVMSVLTSMTDEGGKFFDFQAKQAETLAVQMANLSLAWNNMLNEIGQSHQGLLSGSLGVLKSMFQHWEGISTALGYAAGAFGVMKAAQILATIASNANVAAVTKQVRATKTAEVAELNRAAATRKLTAAEQEKVRNVGKITAADYRQNAIIQSLTREEAKRLLILNSTNKALAAALVAEGKISATMAKNITSANIFTQSLRKLGLMGVAIGKQIAMGFNIAKAAMRSFLPMAIIMAVWELGSALLNAGKKAKEFGRDVADAAKEGADSFRDFLETTKSVREALTNGAAANGITPPSQKELEATWEKMKEELENSAAASADVVASLENIPDLGERIKQGFTWIEELSSLASKLESIAGKVEFDNGGWFGDSFATNVKEYISDSETAAAAQTRYNNLLKDATAIAKEYGISLDEAREHVKGGNAEFTKSEIDTFAALEKAHREYVSYAQYASKNLKSLSENAKETAKNMADVFAAGKEYGGLQLTPTAQLEAVEQFVRNYAKEEKLTAQQTATLRLNLLKDYIQQVRDVYDEEKRYADAAGQKEIEARKQAFNAQINYGRIITSEFFSWVATRYKSQFENLTLANGQAVRDMTQEQIRGITTTDKAFKDFVDKYGKEWAVQTGQNLNTLKAAVNDANNLSVTIPVWFQVQESLSDIAQDFEKRTGLKATQDVKQYKNLIDLTSAYQKQLTDAKKELEALEKAGVTSSGHATLGQSWLETKNKIADAENVLKSYNAEVEKTNKQKKTGRQTKPEDLVAKALKDELSIIKEMQGNYDKLRKAGVDANNALAISSQGYEETIKSINKELTKYGIAAFKASDFVGKDATNPHILLDALVKQYDDLLKSGKVNRASLKELEVFIQKLTVDAKEYDMTQITKGLNRELSNLKEEYELGVELDANPELGNMFADWFGVDTKELPRTIKELLDKANKITADYVSKWNAQNGTNFAAPTNMMTANLPEWATKVGMSIDSDDFKALENIQKYIRDTTQKAFVETEKALDDYVKKYGDYSDKIAEIEQDRLERIKKLNNIYYDEQLRQSYDYQAKLNAINEGAMREKGQVKWDAFKQDDLYVKMFENIDNNSVVMLEYMREKLESLRSELGALNPTQLKEVIAAIQKIDTALMQRNPYKNFSQTIKDGVKALLQLNSAQKKYVQSKKQEEALEKKIAELKEELKEAQSEGDEERIEALEEEINTAEQGLEVQKRITEESKTFADNLKQAAKNMHDAMSGVVNQFSMGVDAAVDIRDTLAGVGVDFGEELNGFIDGIQEASQGAQTILQGALSIAGGNVVGGVFQIISGVIKGLVGSGKAFASIFGGKKKDYFSKFAEQLERLEGIVNKATQNILKSLSDMSGPKAVAEYKKLKDLNEDLTDSYRDLARRGGDSGGSWGGHSYVHRSNERLRSDWMRLSKIVGQSITSVQDLYNLDPAKLKDIMTYAPDAWAKLSDEIREPLEKVIEYGEQAVEYAEAFNEALTSMSFDDVNSSFESMLNSWTGDTEEFMDNFEKMMRQAIVRTVMTEYATPELEKWYNDFAKRLEDGTLSEADYEALQQRYEQIINNSTDRLSALAQATGQDLFSGDKNLSNLQQGIQNITESTAESISAYLNGISGQIYLQSNILSQIKETITGVDYELSLSLQSQMLLQLQNSYTVIQSIHSLMEGWNNASGRALRVELI